MPATGDADTPPFYDLGAAVAQLGRRGGEGGDHIHHGYGARDLLQFGRASLTAARISARMPRSMRSTSSRAPSIRDSCSFNSTVT